MQNLQKKCKNDYHGSDFIYYCLYRDCNQSNRYICKNCKQNRIHEHRNHCHDVVEIEKLEQQLQFDTDWIYDNFDQIKNIVDQLEELQNILSIERKYMLLFKTQKLKQTLSNLTKDKFNKVINLITLDECSLNQMIKDIYLYSEYREAYTLLRYFRRVYRSMIVYRYSNKACQIMNYINERLAFIGSRKFDQNKYQLVEVTESQSRKDCVFISQNEQLLAYTFISRLNLVTIQNMNKKHYYCQQPIEFIEFTQDLNFLFVKHQCNLKLYNITIFKYKFTIFTDGYELYDDKYAFLVRSYLKIKYYNKQSRKQIWKKDIKNGGISYETKNQLIAITENYENIKIINIITKNIILLQKTFKTYQVQQMILRDRYLYISARIHDLRLLKFNINTEQKCTKLILSFQFSPQFQFSVDRNQNIILFDDKSISIYNKNFILEHQIMSRQLIFHSNQKYLEIRQSSETFILFSENKKTICYYLKQENK